MAKYSIGDTVITNDKGLPYLSAPKYRGITVTLTGYLDTNDHDAGYQVSGMDKEGGDLGGCYIKDECILRRVSSPTPATPKVTQRTKGQRANYRLNQKILAHLQSGKTISPMEALVVHGCMRLAAAICDLRQAGHNIKTDIHHDSNGKQYARYSLTNDVRIAA